MHVDVIDSQESFNELESQWNTIYSKDPEAQFFLSWKWFSRIFHDHPDKCRILAVKSNLGGEYIGFFPIRFKTKWSNSKKQFCNEIQMAGTLHWGQYNGFICDPNSESQIITAFADQLKKMHWERITLKYFYVSEKRINIFLSQFPNDEFRFSKEERKMNGGTIDKLICPYIELPDNYEKYLLSLSSNTRQKIRRFNRKIQNSHELFITTTKQDTLERDLDILVDLWKDKWASTRGRDTEEVVQKYRGIVSHAFENESLYMPILWRNDTPLGILACFVDWHKPNMYFFVGGRNMACKDVFIGWLLHSHNIKWAIEKGMKSYDFLHGNERYKYSYGCKERHSNHLIVKTKSRKNLNEGWDASSVKYMLSKIPKLIKNKQDEDAKIAVGQINQLVTKLKKENPDFDMNNLF